MRKRKLIFLVSFNTKTTVTGTTADSCSGSAKLGDCGPPGECNMRCQWSYPGSVGKCDYNLQIPTCICYYYCSPPPPPSCNMNAGACDISSCGDDCCQARCQAKYPGPATVGTCVEIIGTALRLCLCTYNC
ncbi:hypothetical protein RND81_01G210300 [Saponaria officinalis]|uniref:Defensin-like protein n=1 Tax=Saponaria officinalis TaxID=3572 RepID=A0AAW1NGF4_SAPOF